MRHEDTVPTVGAGALMPTPAKLVGALTMALVGWITAEAVVRFALAEWMAVGFLREMAALIGLVLGWRVLGDAATGARGRGDRLMVGMTAGLGTVVMLVLSVVAIHAVQSTWVDATQLLYGGPSEAVEAALLSVRDDLLLVMEPRVAAVMLGGGAVAGLAAGVAGRVWW